MKNTTRLLPGFHLPTLRRKPKTTSQQLVEKLAKIKKHSISQLSEFFSGFIPQNILKSNNEGHFSRTRLYSKSNTFWAFFSQVLDADSGCSEAVRKIQAHMAAKSNEIPSTSTSAYCQARKNLTHSSLQEILDITGKALNNRAEN